MLSKARQSKSRQDNIIQDKEIHPGDIPIQVKSLPSAGLVSVNDE